MNPSNLAQMSNHARLPRHSSSGEVNDLEKSDTLDSSEQECQAAKQSDAANCINTEESLEQSTSSFRHRSDSEGSSHRCRRGSGSFRGAEESEEEIGFAGYNSHRENTSLLAERRADSVIPSLNFSSTSGYEPLIVPGRLNSFPEEEKMKRKLKFFFMNPRDKYLATRQIPWKLLLQILKVFVVTTQLWIFAEYRYAHVNYYSDQTIAFEHFFIKDWDPVREVHAYPPATGKLALYMKSDFYDFVDFSVSTFRNIEIQALGPMFKNSSFFFCAEQFRVGNITSDLNYVLDPQVDTTCISLKSDQLHTFNSTQEWFHAHNFTVNWYAVQRMAIKFNLTSVAFKSMGPDPTPDCFQFKVRIEFDNTKHDGQIPVNLVMDPVRLDCPHHTTQVSNSYTRTVALLNLFVIFISISSLVLCLRALLRAQILKHEADAFFSRNYGWSLTVNEKLEFLNMWYVMICTNDGMIILGSIIKQLIENKSIIGDMWDICSLLLGTGNLLVWFGLLRYLGFFKTYNVLILTMKGAAPNMLRFLICASFIYIGFVFAGWVILGPYHFKFETIMSTSECLFSLINGDDMFATFNSIPREQAFTVWVYSRIYLYTFICLFIYVVLSLFISIIMDTYEIIKNCYERGFPANRLEQFYCTSRFDFKSGLYQGESVFTRLWSLLRSRWPHPTRHHGYEQID